MPQMPLRYLCEHLDELQVHLPKGLHAGRQEAEVVVPALRRVAPQLLLPHAACMRAVQATLRGTSALL